MSLIRQLISRGRETLCRKTVETFIKGHERSFGLCSKNLQRYIKPEKESVTQGKRQKFEQQRKVEEIQKVAGTGIPQDQVSSPDVKAPSRSPRTPQEELEENFTPFRYVYPEFLPDPKLDWRNRIREKLERIDMLKRRSNIDIPEFYVGSILKVSVSDKYAVGKTNEFVGICIEREGCGLRAFFTLRNVVDGQGVEIRYEMYNPIIQSIQVLRLEKRLDDSLRYLRDCPLEYSTFPMDMAPEFRNQDAPVPINATLVRIKPRPWNVKWHLHGYRGIENLYSEISEPWEYRKWASAAMSQGTDSNEFDLMKTYRETIPAEEQTEIFSEVGPQLSKLTQTLKKQKKKRVFTRPQKLA